MGPPDGTTLINGATERINHQYFTYDPNTKTYGGKFPPQKFYRLDMQENTKARLHPDYGFTTVWGFDGVVPGPLIQAKYGEPVLVRFQNSLPSVKVPQAFGIAEMTTHLHNGHTPTESDGNPVDFFNSINDTGPLAVDPETGQKVPVNPHGFKDQHYPNVYAGYFERSNNSIGDPAEALSSLWYHDHHLDFTAQNVYKGMFGCYNLFDDVYDTGHETTGLRLPKRTPMTFPSSSMTSCSSSNYQPGFRSVRPRRHPGRQVLRQRSDPALFERREAALSVPAVQSGTVTLVASSRCSTAPASCRSGRSRPTATCCRTR